jgi:autotransporter passenger strand-loop-strand repeat protein
VAQYANNTPPGLINNIPTPDPSSSKDANATLGAGNVLQVVAGGQTYDLNLDPSQDFASYGFALTSNAFGDTDVALVPEGLTSAATTSGGQTSSNVSVGSGGSIDVLSGGTVSGGTISRGGSLDVDTEPLVMLGQGFFYLKSASSSFAEGGKAGRSRGGRCYERQKVRCGRVLASSG